jgi:acetylornithine aminotransferase
MTTMFEVGLLGFLCGSNPTRLRFLPPPAITTKDHIDLALRLLNESLHRFRDQLAT